MLERGFSKPTERIEKLRQVIIDAVPQVESERAVLITQSYKETEGQPTIIRRAKAVEKIFNEVLKLQIKPQLIMSKTNLSNGKKNLKK